MSSLVLLVKKRLLKRWCKIYYWGNTYCSFTFFSLCVSEVHYYLSVRLIHAYGVESEVWLFVGIGMYMSSPFLLQFTLRNDIPTVCDAALVID